MCEKLQAIEALKAGLRKAYGTSVVDSINPHLFTDIFNGGIQYAVRFLASATTDPGHSSNHEKTC